MYRVFSNTISNGYFSFENDQEHHLINVLRLKVNDKIIVINNKRKYQAVITSLNPLLALLEIEIKENNELPIIVTMIMPLLKNQKNDWLIQKATEMGVNKIIPIILEHCVVKESKNFNNKLKRWSEITRLASQQSNRNSIVEITHLVTNLNDLTLEQKSLNLLALETEQNQNLRPLLKVNNKNINFIFGPEGGFSEKELIFFRKNNFINISLGKRILRAETAPLVFLSNLIYEYEM